MDFTLVLIVDHFEGGGVFRWKELVGSEVNAVTSCQLPPRVVSVVLPHMTGCTLNVCTCTNGNI